MALEKSEWFENRKDCEEEGGTWHSEPVPMCITKNRVDVLTSDMQCKCDSVWEGNGTGCHCWDEYGRLTLSVDGLSMEIKRETDLELGKVGK